MGLGITRKIISIALLAAVGLAPAAAVAQPNGRILCEVTENGAQASGTISVRDGGQEVASGTCGQPLAVPAGEYRVQVRLDGALDRPQQTRAVRLGAGSTERVRIDFETGILQVQATADGRRAAARAELFQNGRRIGMLAGGVGAHVSTGTYSVVVKYRNEERRFDGITVARGQQRVLSAEF